MDIDLARTFLEIARCGSFVAAAERLHVTQTTVTARMQNLESQLGCRLFVRNRAGARLTADGEHFRPHAARMVQAWQAARRDLPLPSGHRELLALGAEVSLAQPLLPGWVARLREAQPALALRTEAADGDLLQQRIEQGTLDLALVYQPLYWPGLMVEQLVEERLVQVRSSTQDDPYIHVDWGPVFRRQHDAALPEHARSALSFNLGPVALQYILQHGGRGYFRTRAVRRHLDAGTLARVADAPEFAWPVFLVYARGRDVPALQQAITALRDSIAGEQDWAPRAD